MERALSAPGKLYLAGEYAVLWGGVARVLATGPRAWALLRPRPDRLVQLVLEEGRLTGASTPAGVRWDAEVPPAFHFAARAIDLAYRAAGLEGPGFSVAFSPSPTSAGRKLGLGSSARATVLAVEAARLALGASFDTLKLALLAHADAQGGKGSGGDVAACFAGGVVAYRRYDVTRLSHAATSGGLGGALGEAPPVELLRARVPTLPLVYAFSGESASTGALIGQVERRLSEVDRERFVLESDALGERLEEALARGHFAAAREAAQELQALLSRLEPTRAEGLERLLALGSAYGCAGKQSGAGGGDGALLIAPDEGARAALLAGLADRGLLALPVAAQGGLSGEVERPAQLARWLDAAQS